MISQAVWGSGWALGSRNCKDLLAWPALSLYHTIPLKNWTKTRGARLLLSASLVELEQGNSLTCRRQTKDRKNIYYLLTHPDFGLSSHKSFSRIKLFVF